MRLDHRIFQGPLSPELDETQLQTPKHYSNYPAGKNLPDHLPAWLVQDMAFPDMQPGLVADSFGFEDSPDAEWISGGTNSKGPTSLALGRQGNLFMWGFYAPPGNMTESGRRVFLNSVAYISKFKDARPLVARRAPARERVFLYMHYVAKRKSSPRTQEIVEQLFPAELLERTQYDVDAIVAYYRSNLEYLHREDGRFLVDEQVKALGLSNRKLEFLDNLAARLAKKGSDPIAFDLLKRYLDPAIAPTPEAFPDWLKGNRDQVFFSDVAGFRWFLPTVPTLPPTTIDGQNVTLSLDAEPRVLRAGETAELVLRLKLANGWHTYTPMSPGGFPLAMDFDWPEGIEPVDSLRSPTGHLVRDEVLGDMWELQGEVEIRQRIRIGKTLPPGLVSIPCRVGITVCDPQQCLPAQVIDLSVQVLLEKP